MESFIEYSNKREYYSSCLSDIYCYLSRHSISLKNNKMNNMKGVLAILMGLQENIDEFIKQGEDIELIVKDGKITGVSNDLY